MSAEYQEVCPADPACTELPHRKEDLSLLRLGLSIGSKHAYLSIQRETFSIKPSNPVLYSAEIFSLTA